MVSCWALGLGGDGHSLGGFCSLCEQDPAAREVVAGMWSCQTCLLPGTGVVGQVFTSRKSTGFSHRARANGF